MKKQIVNTKTGCMVFMLLVFCLGQIFAAPCGDVNSSGGIDIIDGLLIAQYYVGLNPANFDQAAADVNADGSINVVDALLVAQYYVGLITELSCSTSTPTPGTGTITGSEVLLIGDSFIAMSHEITRFLEQHAMNAGILPSNQSFRDNSVSGALLSGTIPQQYTSAAQQGPVKWVIMDGGGNDCMGGGDGSSAYNAAVSLFNEMASDGVSKVLYMFYPDPLGSFAGGGLESCLDVLRPRIKSLCEGLASPECYFVDLRESWDGHPEYTSDGIHPTTAGCQATADAVWEVIQNNNFFNTN